VAQFGAYVNQGRGQFVAQIGQWLGLL
jgi:hypothetical protein